MRLRLHHRLALPFAALAVAATAVATLLALSEARRWMVDQLRAEAVNTADLISHANWVTNSAILRVAAELTGVDAVTFRDNGEVVASTFIDAVPADLLALVIAPTRSADWRGGAAGGGRPIVREAGCGNPCFIAYQDVPGQPGLMVAVVAGRGTGNAVSTTAVRTIVLTAAIGVVLMIGMSQWLARRVTAPIQQLVDIARAASPENSRQRAPEGDDDVGRLGAAFNSMLNRLAASQQALVRSEKLALAGLMAARVAHDVRNPLSSIKMEAQLLRAHVPPHSDQAAMVASMLRDIDHVESVVRDLLDAARPAALHLEPCLLADAVRQTTAPMLSQLAHRKIQLVLDVDAEAPPIPLDAQRFRQALGNLLTNAAEASRAGDTITISTRMSPSRDAQILEVCDDGVGLDPSIRDRLFEPFVSSKRDGVGLGLVNARATVESHRGRITVEPRQPRGTRVTVTLPTVGPAPGAGEAQHG